MTKLLRRWTLGGLAALFLYGIFYIQQITGFIHEIRTGIGDGEMGYSLMFFYSNFIFLIYIIPEPSINSYEGLLMILFNATLLFLIGALFFKLMYIRRKEIGKISFIKSIFLSFACLVSISGLLWSVQYKISDLTAANCQKIRVESKRNRCLHKVDFCKDVPDRDNQPSRGYCSSIF